MVPSPRPPQDISLEEFDDEDLSEITDDCGLGLSYDSDHCEKVGKGLGGMEPSPERTSSNVEFEGGPEFSLEMRNLVALPLLASWPRVLLGITPLFFSDCSPSTEGHPQHSLPGPCHWASLVSRVSSDHSLGRPHPFLLPPQLSPSQPSPHLSSLHLSALCLHP